MPIQRNDRSRCLVVGAGIAGLLAARALQERGFEVTVLDKGRGVGGRMATRRLEEAAFDHGAQFFTARDERFRALVSGWMAAGAAQEWCRGFAGPNGARSEDGHPRYRGASGMTSVPKALAQGLNVLLERRIEAIFRDSAGWVATTASGERWESDALLLTPPVPQSLALLDAGGVALDASVRVELEAIQYDPCIALLVVPQSSTVPEPGGIQIHGEPIAFIADNRRKGISEAPAITLHAGPDFSRACWDSPDEAIAADLLAAASPWVGGPPVSWSVHRWRFARPSRLHPRSHLVLKQPLPIAFAGDAFSVARVEGAALSGLDAAAALVAATGQIDVRGDEFGKPGAD